MKDLWILHRSLFKDCSRLMFNWNQLLPVLPAPATTSPDGANLDVVDLSAEMVALMSAQTLFDVNLTTLKTADQMQKSLIDLTI